MTDPHTHQEPHSQAGRPADDGAEAERRGAMPAREIALLLSAARPQRLRAGLVGRPAILP